MSEKLPVLSGVLSQDYRYLTIELVACFISYYFLESRKISCKNLSSWSFQISTRKVAALASQNLIIIDMILDDYFTNTFHASCLMLCIHWLEGYVHYTI